MGDRVLVAVPGLGVLALDVETYKVALVEGARLTAAPTGPPPSPAVTLHKLVSAEEMEVATGVPASWFASQARERRIPFRKVGRYVRFNFEEVMGCEGFQRRAIPPGQLCTGPENRRGGTDA
jgi:hypothetical protein